MNLELRENETLIESSDANYNSALLGFIPQINQGKLYITNQRVMCKSKVSWRSDLFELPLDQVASFSAGAGITLMTTDGKKYKMITGFCTKKDARALEQVGIKRV